jgi:hypothetical protein
MPDFNAGIVGIKINSMAVLSQVPAALCKAMLLYAVLAPSIFSVPLL